MIYNDISPRTQAYVDRRLLTRAIPNNILGQFGQVRVIPSKSTSSVVFRRYNRLPTSTTPLTEGVTPSGRIFTKTDVVAQLKQYGDYTIISDVIQDTHEDPVLKECTDALGEQAAETYDVLRAGILAAGTNVIYANGTARNAVNTVVTNTMFRNAVRTLKRQEAKHITNIVKAGPNIATLPIPPAYIAVCHPDLQKDLEGITGWVPMQQYSSTQSLFNGEIGSFGEFRVILDTNIKPWTDGGGAKGSMLSTTGTYADVYPMLIFAKDAYGLVELAGKHAVSTYVNNPKPIDSDPLAQRGTVGWKGYTTTAILNDLWMCRLEVAATA